jgi:hypothetical protein
MLLRIIGQGVCSFRYSLAKGKALRAARCGHVASLAPSIRRQGEEPKLAASGAKSPIVSGGYLKYSRFWETATAGKGCRS